MTTTTTISIGTLTKWLADFNRRVTEQQDHLTELDSAIGDADHGANMVRGMSAVMTHWQDAAPTSIDELLKGTGMTLVSSVGGASGPLYGTFFLRMAAQAGSRTELDAGELGAALRAGSEGVVKRGKPELGDKTMYDALSPALEAYDQAVAGNGSIAQATADAARAAESGRDSTKDLIARKGRASYLGERSVGHIDPGSASVVLLFGALAEVTVQ